MLAISEKKVIWKPGSTYNPFKIENYSEGFEACRDLNKPIICQLPSGEKGTYFPSGRYVKHYN